MTHPALPSPPGHVEIDGETATLRFERDFPQTPEQVWEALTQPEQLAKWYMAEATIEGRVGGRLEMVSGPARFRWTGAVLAWEPPHVLAYEFNAEPRPELPHGETTVVRYELTASGTGTHLVLTHSRLSKGTALGFAPGTHAYLDRLAAQLAGEALPAWMVRYDEVKHAYPAWRREG